MRPPDLTSPLMAMLVFSACSTAPTAGPDPCGTGIPTAPEPERIAIVVRGADTPAHVIARGQGSAQIFHDRSTSPSASLTVLVLAPGASVPPHRHPDSVEMLYVLEGSATMRVDGVTFELGPGDVVWIPMNAEHEALVTGEVPLRAVQVYTPAGPEARFRPAPPSTP